MFPTKIIIGDSIQATHYIHPRKITSFIRSAAGDENRTITVCKLIGSAYCNVELFLSPAAHNYYEGHAKICAGVVPGGARAHNAEVYGGISNFREVIYNDNRYVAVDITVRQYGSCALFLTGIHSCIEDILDVTGYVDN